MDDLPRLLTNVDEAQRRREVTRQAESLARRTATVAENALIAAEKAVCDHLAKHHPSLVDELARRRGR